MPSTPASGSGPLGPSRAGAARLWWLALLLAAGCFTPAGLDVVGSWGGTEASLVLTPSGGTVSYSCGAGTIGPSWTLGPSGRFAATGQHFLGGGPVPPQGRPPHPAVYDGLIQGDALTFTVTLTDLGETLGPFHLVRGGPPVLEQCV